jgi:hypothetical protein
LDVTINDSELEKTLKEYTAEQVLAPPHKLAFEVLASAGFPSGLTNDLFVTIGAFLSCTQKCVITTN